MPAMSTDPAPSPALRYAVLHHVGGAEPSHFDLLVETEPGAALATWRCPQWPIDAEIEVERLRDHRRVYLDYEGPVTGGNGFVTRVAGGEATVARQGPSLQLTLDAATQLRLHPIDEHRWTVTRL
jgi:hypothetical protein